MMKYIHTPEDSKDIDTKLGVAIAGPDQVKMAKVTLGELGFNNFPTQRLIIGTHTWPPGRSHGSHHHPNWEQCYYIMAGQAEITVGDEKRIVGPGSSAYMPANVDHNITAVGDEMMVAFNIGCVLDENYEGENIVT